MSLAVMKSNTSCCLTDWQAPACFLHNGCRVAHHSPASLFDFEPGACYIFGDAVPKVGMLSL